MRTRSLIVLLAGAALATAARGQSVNVDFSDAFAVPAETYAAAGLPGVWNAVTASPITPQPLVGLDGAPTSVTIVQSSAADLLGVDDPATRGDDERLLDDFVGGAGDVVTGTTFAGLEPGRYEVLTYALAPAAPEVETMVFIDGDVIGFQIVGGAWTGVFETGVTHARHVVETRDGTITVEIVAAMFGQSGVLNGIQLRRIEAMPGDVDGDGLVNVVDLLLLLADWATLDGADCATLDLCRADFTGDGLVNIEDLLVLLGAWST